MTDELATVEQIRAGKMARARTVRPHVDQDTLDREFHEEYQRCLGEATRALMEFHNTNAASVQDAAARCVRRQMGRHYCGIGVVD
jgi:hypothetical protein